VLFCIRTHLPPNNSARPKYLACEKHRQHVVFRPNGDFFISPSQSNHGRHQTPQSTHLHSAAVPALQIQPAISAAEKSTIAFWPKTKLRRTTGQGPAKCRTHEKTPLCCHNGVFIHSIFS
jgi:hypothetical protein